MIEAWASPNAEGSDDDGEEIDGAAESDAEERADSDDPSDGIQPDDGKLFVAVVGETDGDREGSIAGFGDVRFHPPEYLRESADGGVRAVYVDPDHASEGVGSTLLERPEETAHDRGLDSLGLRTLPSTLAASTRNAATIP